MKITVNIDTSTIEGKQILEYLKGFPELVTFENEILNESQQEYLLTPINNSISSDYKPIEEKTEEKEKSRDDKGEKKLSKAGEWLRSGKSIVESYDMRAVLK
ncbi:MAG: hypothetical protein VB074_07670 [Proteiniphilum sp.]|jgi:hypothetical protein|uniref:hypothetical protein n=1 Tax=Proteiniphilum sp. TaxID=1926877 RepID=UPI0009275CEB|nr:hypothetical protein [Proteiniphilum sp.]MEA5128045.1 hypothetical protein [Proteiniphilum sp.]OJV84309.1 MAG: hypothetical protein BGO34_07215 [Bacteroidia bacterium 44-10]